MKVMKLIGSDRRSLSLMGPAKRRMGAHWTAWTRIEVLGRPFHDPIHTHSKWIWCNNTALANTRSDLEPFTLQSVGTTQLTDCSYRDFMRWMILLGMPNLDEKSQRAGQLIESKADHRSTYAAYIGRHRCAIRFMVRMRSHVEKPGMNPLCCCLRCTSSTGRISPREHVHISYSLGDINNPQLLYEKIQMKKNKYNEKKTLV